MLDPNASQSMICCHLQWNLQRRKTQKILSHQPMLNNTHQLKAMLTNSKQTKQYLTNLVLVGIAWYRKNIKYCHQYNSSIIMVSSQYSPDVFCLSCIAMVPILVIFTNPLMLTVSMHCYSMLHKIINCLVPLCRSIMTWITSLMTKVSWRVLYHSMALAICLTIFSIVALSSKTFSKTTLSILADLGTQIQNMISLF